jgi:hypothetical protein
VRQTVFHWLLVASFAPWIVAVLAMLVTAPRAIRFQWRMVRRGDVSWFGWSLPLLFWRRVFSGSPDPDPDVERDRLWVRRGVIVSGAGMLGFVLMLGVASLTYATW